MISKKLKIAIYCNKDKYLETKKLLKKYPVEIDPKNAKLVIVYGGDGSLLKAEYYFPEIPKLLLKGSKICKLCLNLDNEKILEKYFQGKFKIKKLIKIEVQAKNKILYAINDIIVHNFYPYSAIRYKFFINNDQIGDEIIGDGIVVATPLGSTGYYRSITDSVFDIGLGIAFNNSTEQTDHRVISDDSKIKIIITRGPAIIYADNQEKAILLKTNDIAIIKKSKKLAYLVDVY